MSSRTCLTFLPILEVQNPLETVKGSVGVLLLEALAVVVLVLQVNIRLAVGGGGGSSSTIKIRAGPVGVLRVLKVVILVLRHEVVIVVRHPALPLPVCNVIR